MLRGLIIKQEELYFRLKSKSYMINNQELMPFSLDNLKMVFHIVRGWIVQLTKVDKQLCCKRKPITHFRLCEIFYGFNQNTKGNAERRNQNISLTPVIFGLNRLKGGADRGVVYFRPIVPKIDFNLLET